jgi:hypothetical protein
LHKATTALLIFITGLALVSMVQAQSSQQFSTSQIDDHGMGGSLALDSAGNPHVLFNSGVYTTDDLNQQSIESSLYYAAWVNNSWVRSKVDDSANNGQIRIDSTDCLKIIYVEYNGSRSYLKYAVLKNGIWESQIVDAENPSVGSCGMALDRAGNPHIVYTTSDNLNYRSDGVYRRTVKYAAFTDEKWVIQNIDQVNSEASYNYASIVLDSNGNPYVTYLEGNDLLLSYNLKYAYLVDSQWHNEDLQDNCTYAGKIVLDATERPGIIYKQGYYISRENGWGYQNILGYGHRTETGWQFKCIDPESDPLSHLERSNKFFLNYDSKNNPRVYLAIAGDVKQGNGSLLYTYLSDSGWHYGNLGLIDIGSTYIENGPYIEDMAFDSYGNPAFIADWGIGTTRGAQLTGNLMYISMNYSQNPLENIWLPIIVAVSTIAILIVIIILFKNKGKRAKATANKGP